MQSQEEYCSRDDLMSELPLFQRCSMLMLPDVIHFVYEYAPVLSCDNQSTQRAVCLLSELKRIYLLHGAESFLRS